MASVDEPGIEAIQERVRRLVLRLIGRHDVLDDVTQSAMEAYIKARPTYRGEGPIEAFVDRIAAYTARSWIRKRHRRNLLREVAESRTDWPQMPPGPAEEAETRDRLRRVLEILEYLSPRYRVPFMLYYVERKPIKEIADIEGIKESAVRTRLHRARLEVTRRARLDPVLSQWFEELGGKE
jgi:RNA polymerase sigma-70 factor (ECF subfamily)